MESESELHQIITKYLLLLIITANNKTPGPLTSIFFDVGGKISTTFSKYFIVGAPISPLYQKLYTVSINLSEVKFKMLYSCGNGCDNIYSLSNCGKPWVVYKCSFCDRDIGGTRHILVQRPGHRTITDQEAVSLATNSVSQYLQKGQKPGLPCQGVDPKFAGMREMQPFPYLLLHMFVVQYLEFLADFNTNAVQTMVESDLHTFFSQADLRFDQRSVGNYLASCPEPHLIMYKILPDLPNFLQSQTQLPVNVATRERFETAFDELIKPIIANTATTCQDFRASPGLSRTEIRLDEKDSNPSLLAAYFRETETAMLKLLEDTWKLSSVKREYPVIYAVLSNLELFEKIRPLRPIIRFTSYLLDRYNHRISRKEARKKLISSLLQEDQQAADLYPDFQAAWADLDIDLQEECHQLKKADLKLSEASSIMNVLLDEGEVGGGMYMLVAIRSLGNLQNRLVSCLVDEVATLRKCASTEVICFKACLV